MSRYNVDDFFPWPVPENVPVWDGVTYYTEGTAPDNNIVASGSAIRFEYVRGSGTPFQIQCDTVTEAIKWVRRISQIHVTGTESFPNPGHVPNPLILPYDFFITKCRFSDHTIPAGEVNLIVGELNPFVGDGGQGGVACSNLIDATGDFSFEGHFSIKTPPLSLGSALTQSGVVKGDDGKYYVAVDFLFRGAETTYLATGVDTPDLTPWTQVTFTLEGTSLIFYKSGSDLPGYIATFTGSISKYFSYDGQFDTTTGDWI